MKKNDDLFSMADVCEFYGLSESTIRRKVRNSRNGEGNFPLPLFGSGCRVLWRKDDILNWGGEDSEVVRFHHLPVQPPHQPVKTMSNPQVHRELAKLLGVKPPIQHGDVK